MNAAVTLVAILIGAALWAVAPILLVILTFAIGMFCGMIVTAFHLRSGARLHDRRHHIAIESAWGMPDEPFLATIDGEDVLVVLKRFPTE